MGLNFKHSYTDMMREDENLAILYRDVINGKAGEAVGLPKYQSGPTIGFASSKIFCDYTPALSILGLNFSFS